MKTKKKTIIALLVALVMVLVIVPITVFAGTGTQTDPYKSTDKNNGEDGTCLVLYQCDENGNTIQSLEKYDNMGTNQDSYRYSFSNQEPTTLYFKLAYKDGSAINADDWLFKNDTTAVQSKKIWAWYKPASDTFDVKINGISFKDYTNGRVWIDPGDIYRIDFPPCSGNMGAMRFLLGDGTNFASTTLFNVFFALDTFGDTQNNKMGIDAATIADIPAQTYTGEAITPELNITYNDKTLVKDTDYTVEFANNTEVGTASVTITGIGDFDWHVTKTFEIQAAEPVAPELVSSKGNDLIAKTYTNLELKNAPGEGYEYKFIVYNDSTKQWYKLKDFGPETEFDWYTGPAGVKNLYVDIKNKNDETDVTRVELTGVNVTDSGLKATLAIEPTGELAAKSQAKLTATATGGTGEYQYKFIVFNATTNQWYKLKDFGPESTFDWYTGPAGTKTLYVDVKDANGVVVRQPLENIVVK